MTNIQPFSITQPTEIHFGEGIISTLPEVIAKLGGTKPLLVIDPGLVNAGLDKDITSHLDTANIAYVTYDAIDPEPGLKLADKGTEIARQNNCDCVVGIGGGSAMDVAKAISILITNGAKDTLIGPSQELVDAGFAADAANVISGNMEAGIQIETGGTEKTDHTGPAGRNDHINGSDAVGHGAGNIGIMEAVGGFEDRVAQS